MRQFGDKVGGAGRNHNRIRIACQIDMRHVVADARIPLICIDGLAGQRLHRYRRDELRCCLCHHHLYRCAGFGQCARKFRHLVTGDTTGQTQHDFFVSKIHGNSSSAGLCACVCIVLQA